MCGNPGHKIPLEMFEEEQKSGAARLGTMEGDGELWLINWILAQHK